MNKREEHLIEQIRKYGGEYIKRIKNKTEAICLEAVRQSGYALKHLPEDLKTGELCIEAVKKNGDALKYVPEHLKTETMCWEAVRKHRYALNFVPDHLKPLMPYYLETVRQKRLELMFSKRWLMP